MLNLKKGVSRRPEGSASSWSGNGLEKGQSLRTVFWGVPKSTSVGSSTRVLMVAPFVVFGVSSEDCIVFALPDGRIKPRVVL